MPMKQSQVIRRPSGKPCNLINSNLVRPPDKRFISKPKNRKLGMNPYQKRFSLVASKMPLLAKTKPSSHFLQFINTIISHDYFTYLILYYFSAMKFRQDKNYNGRRILLGVTSSLAKSVLVVILIWEISYASK